MIDKNIKGKKKRLDDWSKVREIKRKKRVEDDVKFGWWETGSKLAIIDHFTEWMQMHGFY